VHWLPLASGTLGILGALVVIVIILLVFGLSTAASLGPIIPVITAIVKSVRNSTTTDPNGSALPGIEVISPGTRVVAVDPGSSFGQAFSASLQRSLGPQLGQTLGQFVAIAAAQHPLELQLAPLVLAIDAARRQGDATPVRPFLTDRFASTLTGPAPDLPGISHLALAQGSAVAGDHVVIRIDRGTGVAAHTEYWAFQKATAAPPEGTPEKCPQCGAPTAGDYSGTCRFCGATLPIKEPVLPQATRWLLDDISSVPPAVAA
jgi:hypothetical protein